MREDTTGEMQLKQRRWQIKKMKKDRGKKSNEGRKV